MKNSIEAHAVPNNSNTGNGELFLPGTVAPETAAVSHGFFKTLGNGVKSLFTNIKQIFKDKKRLIPALIMGALWVFLILLPAFGVNSSSVKFLSWLTFARGGLGGSILNKAAGIFGKGLFAFLITSLITGKGFFRKIKSGLSQLFKNNFQAGNSIAPPWFFGMGIALAVYNIMTVNMTLINTMTGIVCFILSLRALGSKSGFIFNLFNLAASKIKVAGSGTTARLMSGFAAGFALGVLASFIPFDIGGYILGGAAILTGIVIAIVRKSKPEVKKA